VKIAILGAGGVRTPLIVNAMAVRRERIGLTELALMDIDGERLESIGGLLPRGEQCGFTIDITTDGRRALQGADFVVTTFRVGGTAARIADERIPLAHGVLGQETTGPGGFAMALRTIPVLLGYIALMRELCPEAWLINFANPAGLLAQAAIGAGQWPRTVGICDAPAGMARVAAAVMRVPADELELDYFGLNHLGWLRAVRYKGADHLPGLIAMLNKLGGLTGLPFSPDFIAALGMIPNEYLLYYYQARTVVDNLCSAEKTRGQTIAELNDGLFAELARLRASGDIEGMKRAHAAYLTHRGETYMAGETGGAHSFSGMDRDLLEALAGEGYAGVALDLIEALQGARPRRMVLNIPNRRAIAGMAPDDVVEVSAHAAAGAVHPLAAGSVPAGALGLMLQVKTYERLAIEAATEGSYAKAHLALTLHPLVRDEDLARTILDEFGVAHAPYWPELR
jgi:6-phospho-beta-glucosidase